MTGLLIDEMFPPATAALLRERGHDAFHVSEVGLRAVDDTLVAEAARAGQRAVVTENVIDFALEPIIVLVFVLKRHLPSGGGQAATLARTLDRWLRDNPKPYLGAHWPSVYLA